ncbi:MAG: PAS domain S-box protein [Bacteroidota bacterium]
MIKRDTEDINRELERLQRENKLLKKLLRTRSSMQNDSLHDDKMKDPPLFYYPMPDYRSEYLKSLPLLMWVKDKSGKYVSVNDEFANAFGFKKEFFNGLSDYEFLPKVFADRLQSEDLKIIRSGTPKISEELFPLNGGVSWYETVRIPFVEDNEIMGVAAFSKDISHRKQRERDLKESEEKFRELAENTTDSFILRSGNKILYVNPAFEQVYGYSRKELIDNPDLFKEWIHPADRERILDVLQSESYKSTYIFNEQYRIIKKDGTESWIWNRSFPVWNDKGEAYRIVSVAANISEIKFLEENLLKSQSQLQTILDNIPHLAWLKGIDGKYISVNKSFCDFFKLLPKEIIGKTDYELCPKKIADDYIRKDKLVISTRQSRQFYEIEKKNSQKRYSETFKSPVINDHGDVIGVAGISRDITDQKLAEKALMRSEEKFKDLVTLLPEVVFETDEEGTITFANLKGFELMEYSQSDLIKGKTIFDLIVSEDSDRVKQIFKSFRYGSELKGKEFGVITKSGRVVPVLVFTKNMYHDNEWCGIRGVMVDISKRKEAEKQEKIYQSKLLYLSDTALDFLSIDPDTNLFHFIGSRLKEMVDDIDVIINRFDEQNQLMIPEFLSFTEKKEKMIMDILEVPRSEFYLEVKEDHMEHFKHNADHLYEFREGFYESSFGKISENKSESLHEKLKIKRVFGMTFMRSGKLFGSVLILTSSEKLRDKHFIETFIYQSSIALHRRQLELELRDAKTLAEESDKLKTSFLANMSHEIRTPMNGILGLTEMLSNNKIEEKKYKEYLAMINANGKLLMNIVNDIIDISKIEARQVDVIESEFSLKELIDEVHCIISAERMAKNKENVELKSNVDLAGRDAHIIADQAKIKQVLINLTGNAVKFTKDGSVSFGARIMPNKKVLFYVKDTGIGIPEEKQSVIFNRFTQADQSSSRSFSGSGLGLAISKGFVELMDGEIWVESKFGEGAKFCFTIPLKMVTRKRIMNAENKKEISEFRWENLNILVVEDNLVSYKLLEISLSKTGCKTFHAENGIDAIEIVKAHPEIDIVLMDIQLPLMNGYEATREIKKIRPDLPVIAQTANAMDSDRAKCMEAGCSDYVTKPIVLKNLLPKIEDFIKEKEK